MYINHLSITSPSALFLDFTPSAPICMIRGRYSDLVLDLFRELMGDYGARLDPNRIDDGRFIVHADFEMDGKEYDAWYIRNADTMGDCRLAVNFMNLSTEFSSDDTYEFVAKCNARNRDCSNVVYGSIPRLTRDDDRPIFIYDFFDRLDQALDLTPMLDSLASLGRQVFVAVCPNYPVECITHDKVQTVSVD